MTRTDTISRTEKATEPPKAWRNRWCYLRRYAVVNNGVREETFEVGEVANSKHLWPTRDVAETAAKEWLAGFTFQGRPNTQVVKYLGAFPQPVTGEGG